jgi:hypothetical protein
MRQCAVAKRVAGFVINGFHGPMLVGTVAVVKRMAAATTAKQSRTKLAAAPWG